MKKAAQDNQAPAKLDAHHQSPQDEEEFIEIEEEPNTGLQEEWERDIPPFLRKLSTMVNDNRDIQHHK